MSDSIKLIIEISKEQYNKIKEDSLFLNFAIMANAIKNGTPLDDVKAEISNIDTYERDGYWVMADVWKVLDNIGKESED